MSNILIPSSTPEDWKQFLADPEKHWKKGYSARSLAYCWHDANGMPKDVLSVMGQIKSLAVLKPIFIIPEHKVPLPGGSTASHNDIWLLAETNDDLISIAVEGKVSEPFGPTVGKWFSDPSPGKEKRLQYLCHELDLPFPPPGNIRYQLLHRTVSAIIEARRFRTKEAGMVVHTFSPTNEWFEDYQAFIALLGLKGGIDHAVIKTLSSGINLHLAWVHGDERFLKM